MTSVGTVLTLATLAYALVLVVAIAHGVRAELQRQDRSVWWLLGAIWGWGGLLRRRPRRAVVVAIAAVIAVLLLGALEISEGERSPENRPPVAPIVADTLRMPTVAPFERARVTWPPFLGHRFALGDRS